MDKRLVNLSSELDELIKFSAYEELLEKLSQSAGKGIAKARAGVAGAANKIEKVGTVGTHDLPAAAADIPKPASLAWGGDTGDVMSSRMQTGVRSYLGSFNNGAQSQAALSAAQKAGMAQRGMSVPGGQTSGGVTGRAKDWWNQQAPGTKLAIGAGGGLAAGYVGSSLLQKDRNQQYIAWLDDIINFAIPKPRRRSFVFVSPSGERKILAPKKGKDPNAYKHVASMVVDESGKPIKPRPDKPPVDVTGGGSGKKFTARIFESAEETIQFADPRPRNPLGEFQQQGEGGPNPNSMATVYKQPGMISSLVKGGTLALAGGAIGQVGGEFGKQATSKVKALLKKARKK